MKKINRLIALSLLILAGLCAPVVILETGCNTTQQTIAYKTLYSLEQATTAAFDAYAGQVIKGTIPTNSLPQVSAKYNQFQAGMTLAVTLARNNTNALASASLAQESSELISLIQSITKK